MHNACLLVTLLQASSSPILPCSLSRARALLFHGVQTGKHGHAKVNLAGNDIFTGKKYEDMAPSTHNMQVPVINRTEYQLCDIDEDGFLFLMNDDGEPREDLKEDDVDADILKDIKKRLEDGQEMLVTILSAMDVEKVVSVKNYNTD